jgi:hypothetical protein
MYETGASARITYEEATLAATSINIESSDTTNGAEYATLTLGMTISNKIVTNGFLSFDLPK